LPSQSLPTSPVSRLADDVDVPIITEPVDHPAADLGQQLGVVNVDGYAHTSLTFRTSLSPPASKVREQDDDYHHGNNQEEPREI
jgi:hypothetical protein